MQKGVERNRVNTAFLCGWACTVSNQLQKGEPRAQQAEDRYLDINTDELSPDYGKVTGYRANLQSGLLQKDRVVFGINTSRFLEFYVDLLTRPVPVTLPAGQGTPADNGP